MMVRLQRPAGEQEIAVSPIAQPDIHLVDPLPVAEVVGQQLGLIVVTGAADVSVDLLQADDVGVLRFDHGQDPAEPVAAIAGADPFMDVITQNAHRWLSGSYRQFPRRCAA